MDAKMSVNANGSQLGSTILEGGLLFSVHGGVR
jgi:hypothetical protein